MTLMYFLELGELAQLTYHSPYDQVGLSSDELRLKRDTNQYLFVCFLCFFFAYGANTRIESEEYQMLLMLEDDVVGLVRLQFLRCLVYTSRSDSVTLVLRLFMMFYASY